VSNPPTLVTGSFRFPADTFNSDALPTNIDFSRAIAARLDIRGDNILMALTINSAVLSVPEPIPGAMTLAALAGLRRRRYATSLCPVEARRRRCGRFSPPPGGALCRRSPGSRGSRRLWSL
jgi:hypothetical protein